MDKVEVVRNGRTNQFSITLVRGSDTIRCMVSVALGATLDERSDGEKHKAALSKAKAVNLIIVGRLCDAGILVVCQVGSSKEGEAAGSPR